MSTEIKLDIPYWLEAENIPEYIAGKVKALRLLYDLPSEDCIEVSLAGMFYTCSTTGYKVTDNQVTKYGYTNPNPQLASSHEISDYLIVADWKYSKKRGLFVGKKNPATGSAKVQYWYKVVQVTSFKLTSKEAPKPKPSCVTTHRLGVPCLACGYGSDAYNGVGLYTRMAMGGKIDIGE